MTVSVKRKIKRDGYHQVLQAAIRLSLTDQQRLLDELQKLSGVSLVPPTYTEQAIKNGRNLADEVRNELKNSLDSGLDETMSLLRGRSWSS